MGFKKTRPLRIRRTRKETGIVRFWKEEKADLNSALSHESSLEGKRCPLGQQHPEGTGSI